MTFLCGNFHKIILIFNIAVYCLLMFLNICSYGDKIALVKNLPRSVGLCFPGVFMFYNEFTVLH